MSFVCNHCNKSFLKESSLIVHSCEPRRRQQEKNERGVQLGFQSYIKFYELMQGSAKLKTFDDFAGSSYYRAFVKFGRYCVNVKVINPPRFVEWLLKQNKKIDHWCRDSIYTEYLIDYLKIEAVDDVLLRAIEYGLDWEDATGNLSHNCLRYGNSNVLTHAVVSGRISPWVIYNSASGQEFLSNLNTEQLAIVWPYLDVDSWQKKFKDYPADQEYVKAMLKQAGW